MKSLLVQHELQCNFGFDVCNLGDCTGEAHFRHHADFSNHLRTVHRITLLRAKTRNGSLSKKKVELEALDDNPQPAPGRQSVKFVFLYI